MNQEQDLDSAHSIPMPTQGISWQDIEKELEEIQTADAEWKSGRVFGIYFPTRDDIDDIAAAAHFAFYRLSTHHPEVFPSLDQLERDVVAMVAALFSNNKAIGNVTCGGTESIILAVKAARDHARVTRGITTPEMVVPATAYPAFAKAGHLLNVNVIRIPIDDKFEADLPAFRRAINQNTVLLGASAPTITHGAIDPIPEIGAIANELGIYFHVDASLGGFQLPFLKRLGQEMPSFDFKVPGVTSLSTDLHKYAYSPMGASVLLHRSATTHKYQGYVMENWVGGTYQTPGILGSRSGGPIAAAWALMRYLGQDGYVDLTRTLLDTTQRFTSGINRIPGLKVFGEPITSVIVYGSPKFDIGLIHRFMTSKGWSGRFQSDPPSIRLLLAPYHIQIADLYLRDLGEAVKSACET